MFETVSNTPINQPTPEDPSFPFPVDPEQTPQLPENKVLLETQRGDFDGNGVEDVRRVYSNDCTETDYYDEVLRPEYFAPLRVLVRTEGSCD